MILCCLSWLRRLCWLLNTMKWPSWTAPLFSNLIRPHYATFFRIVIFRSLTINAAFGLRLKKKFPNFMELKRRIWIMWRLLQLCQVWFQGPMLLLPLEGLPLVEPHRPVWPQLSSPSNLLPFNVHQSSWSQLLSPLCSLFLLVYTYRRLRGHSPFFHYRCRSTSKDELADREQLLHTRNLQVLWPLARGSRKRVDSLDPNLTATKNVKKQIDDDESVSHAHRLYSWSNILTRIQIGTL